MQARRTPPGLNIINAATFSRSSAVVTTCHACFEVSKSGVRAEHIHQQDPLSKDLLRASVLVISSTSQLHELCSLNFNALQLPDVEVAVARF